MENIILISAGDTDRDRNWVVSRLAGAIYQEARAARCRVNIVRPFEDYDWARRFDPARAIVLICNGPDTLVPEGEVKWVAPIRKRKSPQFRQDWFVRITRLRDDGKSPFIKPLEIQALVTERICFCPKHLGRTIPGVRLHHHPSGSSVFSETEDSFEANFALTIVKMKAVLAVHQQARQERDPEYRRRYLCQQRAQPLRKYEGQHFRRKS